jgi:hypothetical protein
LNSESFLTEIAMIKGGQFSGSAKGNNVKAGEIEMHELV